MVAAEHLDPFQGKDYNERFVIRKCLEYLERHFKKYWNPDYETLSFLCWVLGKERVEIGRRIVESIPESERGKSVAFLANRHVPFPKYRETIRNAMLLCDDHVRISRQTAIDLIRKAQKTLAGIKHAGLEKKISAFKNTFNLTPPETEFITFFLLVEVSENTKDYFIDHLEMDGYLGRKLLLNILSICPHELSAVLSGTLKEIEVLEDSKYRINKMKIDIDSKFYALIESIDHSSMDNEYFGPAPRSEVPLGKQMFEKREIDHLCRLLGKKPTGATNVLLHGAPGTGKTSLAYSIAETLGCPAYEVKRGDSTHNSGHMTAAIRACLSMTNAGDGSIIIIDEADYILETKSTSIFKSPTGDKGWVNKIMDEPGARFIWIVNDMSNIDDAVLRRFSYNLEFKPFNRVQQTQLWEMILRKNRVKRFFSRGEIEQLAERYPASAGVIDLAVKKAKETNGHNKRAFRETMEMGLNAAGKLAGISKHGKKSLVRDDGYSLDGLNVQTDLPALMEQIKRFDHHCKREGPLDVQRMCLLFHGPPGTGKSEFAKHIGKTLERKVNCKRASDILDPYVGGTERNIRKAFSSANWQEEILVLDEVDSLVGKREMATHTWEVSFVNEMLSNMESYQGMIICTTNRFTGLDPAVLRRFDWKVAFDYILPENNILFYERLLAPMVSDPVSGNVDRDLKDIKHLTPGDFRVVRDRFFFFRKREISHEKLIKALTDEVTAKQQAGMKRSIGFN